MHRKAKLTRAAGVKAIYHHGDLRNALLRAATAELASNGLANFSLRACARRAGVSHAAPAHHFGDVTGLLAALGIDAFEQLRASVEAALGGAPDSKLDRVSAVAVGYLRFAVTNPELFRLMFQLQGIAKGNAEVNDAGAAAFAVFASTMGEMLGVTDPLSDPVKAQKVVGVWALAHGLADLAIAGQFKGRDVDLDGMLAGLVADLVGAGQ